MAIYSRCVNSRARLEDVLPAHFPWCGEWDEELKRLFDAYVDRKEAHGVLDYDDLLLFWHALLADPAAGEVLRREFDCVLVDEYQDTNALQAEILRGLCPTGEGVTVVGDDAQSIYGFRAATVRNILDLPKQYPGITVLTLEQNYRSTEPILAATNQVIGLAKQRYTKNLWSERTQGERPALVTCEDEDDQTEYVIREILEHRESGIDLRRQAVLFRASHHSMGLEAELARRNIPFHKYGGLKFIETAHIKDLMAFLRLAENPRDLVAGGRLLPLVPGIGPTKARQLMEMLAGENGDFAAWRRLETAGGRPRAVAGAGRTRRAILARSKRPLPDQISQVRKFYAPLLPQLYDNPAPRGRDLEQLEQIAGRYRDRQTMLAEITLDPPSSTQDLAGPPLSGRRLSGAEHDPLGQGPGVGLRVRDPRRGRQHPVGHGHRLAGGNRRRAAAVLRGPDPGEGLALRMLPAAILPLPARHERRARLRAADSIRARARRGVLPPGACPTRRPPRTSRAPAASTRNSPPKRSGAGRRGCGRLACQARAMANGARYMPTASVGMAPGHSYVTLLARLLSSPTAAPSARTASRLDDPP